MRPKMQRGGRKPIVVTNPKDPRIKAYQDSLNLYNKNYNDAKNSDPLMNVDEVIPLIGDEGITHADKKTGIQPIGMYRSRDLDTYNAYWSAFKKPVQPVVYQKPQPKIVEIPEKIFPAPAKAQSRPARITIPEQSQMPEQQGQIMYGPSYGAIGYMNNGVFTPIDRTDHLSPTMNKADLDLLKNPEALQKYVTMTPRYKKGGNYRGKMQTGGKGMFNLDGSWSPGYYDKKTDSWVSTGDTIPAQQKVSPLVIPSVTPSPTNPFGPSPWLAKGQPNPLQPATNQVQVPLAPVTQPTTGWHNTPEDVIDGQTFNERLPQDHPDNPGTGNPTGTYAERAAIPTSPMKSNSNWNTNIFFGLRGAQMAAAFLAEKKRNARMNEYDYKQQTALGQMNPMPVSTFQFSNNDYTTPNNMYAQEGGMMNPYLYHAKYGGNLKTILREHGKWSNDAGPMDMTDGNMPRLPEKAKGGFAIDDMIVRDFISKFMEFGHGPHPYSSRRPKYQDGGLNQEDMSYLRRGGNPAKRQMARHQVSQHGQPQQQQGQQQQIMQLIQAYAQMTGHNPKQIMQQLQQMQPQQQQQAIQQMTQAVQQAQSQGQGQSQPQQQMQPGAADDQQGMMQQGGLNPFIRPTPKLSQDVINALHGLPSQEEQLLRGYNTVVAMPGGSSIPGDSTRYMTGRANQFGVPYTVDKIGVKGISDHAVTDFIGLPKQGGRVYQDSVLGNVNGFFEEGGNWIQGAVNPAHKGWCTPMSNPHCTGKRRQFAMMMKKNHGFHK